MKKIALFSIAIVVFAVLVVFVLFKNSHEINEAPNGFKRDINLDKLYHRSAFKSSEQIIELVGMNDTAIFYRTATSGNILYILYNQSTSQVRSIPYSVDSIIGKKQYRVQLYRDRFYFFANNANYMEIFKLKNHEHELIPLGFKHSAFQIIDTDRILFQVADKTHLNRVFKIFNLKTRFAIEENGLSEKLNDGGLITDGMIAYNPVGGKLTYTYFYGNGFLCFDTLLKLNFVARTIDTFTVFHAKIERVGQVITHPSPPTATSLYSVATDSELFIQSALKADNESMINFKNNSVIDIYSLKDGSYKESFYIPNHLKEPTNSFRVYGNQFVVLFDREIELYTLK